jgi:dephospho-CoA kinase
VVVVVEADDETRVQRMVELRGMAEDEARRRIGAQASNVQRRAIADHVIDANGSLAETVAAADTVWEKLAQQGVGGAA